MVKKQTKKKRLIEEVLKIAKIYTTKLTLRQFHYRLVRLGDPSFYANTTNAYKYLSSVLVYARKNGLVPYDLMEDRTRTIDNRTETWFTFWKEKVNNKIEDIKYAPDPSYGYNLWQREITIIVVEKEALAGIFKNAIGRNSILIVCRGYNSLTQIKDLEDAIEGIPMVKDKEFHCYFFSDFDPSGFDIQRNFKKQCNDLNINFDSFKRIALNETQIDDFSLPYSPTKMTDSRAKNWSHAGVVELDSLDPNILEDLIKDCCSKHWDNDIVKYVNKVHRIQSRKSKKMYAKGLKKVAKEILKEEDSN